MQKKPQLRLGLYCIILTPLQMFITVTTPCVVGQQVKLVSQHLNLYITLAALDTSVVEQTIVQSFTRELVVDMVGLVACDTIASVDWAIVDIGRVDLDNADIS